MATEQSSSINNGSQLNRSGSASVPLFEVVNIPNRLVLEKVYLNGLHALRRFEIRNISQNTILVKLRSNLGSQIAYQLTNENLPEFESREPVTKENKESLTSKSYYALNLAPEDNSRASLNKASQNPLCNITTNTVAAAAAGAFGDANGHQFNQLFNYVNHIDEVEIAPGCSQKIILAFLPDPRNKTRRSEVNHAVTPSSADDLNNPSSALIDKDGDDDKRGNVNIFMQSSEDETHDFFEVNGLLLFFAYVIDKQQISESAPEKLNGSREYVNYSDKLQNSQKIGENYNLTRHSLITKNVDSNEDGIAIKSSKSDPEITSSREMEPVNTSKADYQITIKFCSTVSRSVLWTDVGETGINFDDCVIGGTYFKDFTIWNRSEIELYWLLNTVDLSYSEREDWIKFTDCDTGELLDNKPIPSYSHRRIRITFRPKEIGEFNYDLQLENANDSENVLQSRIHAVVRSVLSEELLVISSGNVLDFGDCCAGAWSKQQLVLKNVSEVPLEIHFAAENAEILFHLNTDYLRKDVKKNQSSIDMEDLSSLQNHFKDITNVAHGTSTTNNTQININSGPISETSSRAISPSLQNHELEGLTLSTENTSESPSEDVSRSTSRHRTKVADDPDTEESIGEDVSGSGFLIKGSTEKPEIGFKADKIARIDEVILGPGKERTVQVSYHPEKDSSANDFKAGKLIRRTFRIIVQYSPVNSSQVGLRSGGHERKIIQCKARSCTPFIDVNPKEVNFGDTDVGTNKSLPITITNLSELTARVELKFVSKVLYCVNNKIVIPPKMSSEVKLTMYPRKVNADYRKQITVVNLQNRDDDQIIEVRSTNIDKNRVTFHSLFYRILTSTGSNFIDFGTSVLNSPRIRTFTIDNISVKKLVLELSSSSPEEIVIYHKRPIYDYITNSSDAQTASLSIDEIVDSSSNVESDASSSKIERREMLLESIGNRRMPKNHSNIDAIGINTKLNLSTTNATLIAGEIHSNMSIKRYNAATFLDGPLSDSTPSSAAYLDLAGSSDIDPRRHSRRRPAKLKVGKTSGVNSVIDRIKGGSITAVHPSISSISATAKNYSRGFNGVLTNKTNDDSVESVSFRSYPKGEDLSKISDIPVESIIEMFEPKNNPLPLIFPKPSDEESYVRFQMRLLRELNNRIRDHQIVPVKIVEIPPSEECQIIVVFTPRPNLHSNVQGLPKKFDSRVNIRLMEFDRDIQQPQFDALLHGDQSQIPVRELMVNATLCRSIMDLGQKNINFGLMDKNERRNTTILIQNRSEVPLLYYIRKSGSIASGDITFGIGRLGVVRGYSKKEVEFSFEPSLSGLFHEKIGIENVRDRENSQVLSVKANIRKQHAFSIQSLNMNFGACLINENPLKVQHIIISNTNKQLRMIEVRVEPQDLKYKACVGELDFVLQEEFDGSSLSGILSKETEEEIESLEQKVKIAKRKGRDDKVKKIEKKLAKLRRGESGKNDSGTETESVDETAFGTTYEIATKEEKVDLLNDAVKSPVEEIFDRSGENSRGPSRPLSRADKPTDQPNKRNVKYKKTQSSIIFPLGPRTTKTISVYFKATRIATEEISDLRQSQESVTGRVYVHEHKNQDIVKIVMFQAVVFYDYFSFLRALNEETYNGAENQTESGISSPVPEFSSLTTDLPDQIGKDSSFVLRKFPNLIGSPLLQGYDLITTSTFMSQSPDTELSQYEFPSSDASIHESSPENLVLEPTDLDIGKLEVNQRHNCYFKLINRGDEPLCYKIIIPEDEKNFFQFTKLHDKLAPQETRRLDYAVIAEKTGRQLHSVIIRNCGTKSEFRFTLHGYIHHPYYLRFPSLGDDGQSELDLGYCYVDPGRKYSQVTPLLVKNITEDDVYITCQSNLSLQVSVFLDESGEKGQVVGTLLKKKTMMTVWVALQPNLLTRNIGLNGGTSNSAGNSATDRNVIANDECRVLIGGIKFSVQVKEPQRPPIPETNSAEELITVTTQTVKFTSLIGRSVFSVSEKLINLGTTSNIGDTFYGSFTIRNLSTRLPLEYAVECPNGNIILDHPGGTLEGRDSSIESRESLRQNEIQGESTICLPPTDNLSSAIINFRVTSSKFGFFRDKIVITNKNNAEQVFEVEVYLFVDNCILDFYIRDEFTSSKSAKVELVHSTGEPSKDLEKLPSISWDDIAVSITDYDLLTKDMVPKVVIQKGYQAANIPAYEQCVEIFNNSESEVLKIAPRSNLDVKVRWGPFGDSRAFSDEELKEDDGRSFKICGPTLKLEPRSKAYFYVSCPQPKSLNRDEIKRVASGKKVNLKGVFFLEDQIQNVVVKLACLNASFCVPIGELNTSCLNVGRIGYSNSWSGVKFQFSLRNISDIPLHYELQSPDCIEILGFMNGGSTDEVNQGVIVLKQTLESHVDRVVTAILQPRRINDFTVGERIFDVNVLNMFNPLNTLTLKVEATLTLFELKFDRLIQGELVLPTLYHPFPPSDLPCDTWFTIINISDQDVRFEISVELAPDVQKFVKVEVLSRFLNSPLIGGVSISGLGTIEVRVRAYPIENVRIPRESSYLTNNDGVTFGKLLVATKQINEDDRVQKVAENIPIRGFIAESPAIFSISPKNILFKTAWSVSEIDGGGRCDFVEESSTPTSELGKNLQMTKDWPAQKDTIVIINHSDKIPLLFKVQIEGPMELSAKDIINVSPLDEDGCGIVGANQKLILEVSLIDLTAAVSEDIKIHIFDLQSLSNQKKTVLVSIESDTREHHAESKSLHMIEEVSIPLSSKIVKFTQKPLVPSLERSFSSQESRNGLPFITLRGCKRIGEATDVGGRYELDLGQQDLGSPTVIKKLTLENSTSQQIDYRLKTVFVNDKNWLNISRNEGTLEATSEDHNRQYIDIHTVTLSFSTSTRNVYSTYLIVENLKNPSDIKTIRILMEVVAHQNLRRGANIPLPNNHVFDVYVNGVDISQTQIEMLNIFYGYEYTARSMPSHEFQELFNQRNPDLMEEKVIEIYVNCRLVKDYQQIVILKAKCKMPSLQVEYEEIDAFIGKISRRDVNSKEEDEWLIQFDQALREIKIKNLLSTPLEYEIVNDTMYFTLEFPTGNKVVTSESFHDVIAIRELLDSTANKFWIYFQLPGYKVSYAFSTLENHTVRFLSDFNQNTDLFERPEDPKDEQANKKMVDLRFQYFFIIDQLVYYATIKTSENWFQLAKRYLGIKYFKKLDQHIFKNPILHT
ncbi:10773_t:CDS:2 [Acaulospora colombiana]|uniref:10773_t:CDS:1 n=1 Tax=Acaulospora colombiana TaxID=27376 RepID=A0ACA9KHR6_9GLOM|nr:10773_t:CDS:2 [Acaulospora colombiana]